MNKRILNKTLKAAMLTVIIVFAALGIELIGFHFQSFVKREYTDILYETDQELPTGIQSVEKKDNSIRLIFSNPTYVQKMRIQADSPEKFSYTIYTDYQNLFDSSTIGKSEDTYWPELGTGYTNMNKKLTVVRLIFPKDTSVKVNSIQFYTENGINKYRVVFLMLVLFFLYFFVMKWSLFVKKPEWLVAVIGLTIGSFFIFQNGIQENGWDEQIHFLTAYQMSFFGKPAETNDTILLMSERIPEDSYNTAEEKALFTQYLNHGYGENVQTAKKTSGWGYKNTGYMLQALVIWIGRMLHLPFNRLYMLGRLGNLLTYVFLMFWAVRLMPTRKELIFALALFPTQIFIASTYTYDATINGLLMLGFVLWIRAVQEDKKEQMIYNLIGSILAFGIGSLSKAIYIPLLLLCCLIPREKFRSSKQYYLFWGVIVAGCILVAFTFIWPMIRMTVTNQVGVSGDSRGGDTDAVLQMKSMLHHPIQYAKILLKDIFESAGYYVLGHAGIANFGRMGELDGNYIYLTLPWILYVVFTKKKGESFAFGKICRWGMAGAICVIVAFIWTAMYLSYTPVGQGWIKGVQARYYFPVLAPMICLIPAFPSNLKAEFRQKILAGIPVFVLLVEIYKVFLKGQCL